MLRKAIALWKKRNENRTTLYKRLLLFFILISISLVLTFTLLLSFFGITGKQDYAAKSHLSTEISIISDKIDEDFGLISVDGIAMAEELARRSDAFFDENRIDAEELQEHPELIEPLLSEHMQLLINIANNRYCGGVFVMLDATVDPDAEGAESSRAGVFLKKTLPTATSAVGVDIHCLRGPSQIARDSDIMLMGQWHMEYDISGQDFFTEVMQTARDNPDLELSRLYYWSGRVSMKDNSEEGFLLCVPLRSEDGTVFGLCGVEISDRLFKQLYTPEGGEFENIFTVMAPICDTGICTSKGLLAGNSYLTGNRWDHDLIADGEHDDFDHYEGVGESYGGKSATIRLYPNGSPYSDEQWAVAVLMPKEILHDAAVGNYPIFLVIVFALLIVSILGSLFISKMYIQPVNEALDSIHSKPSEERKATSFVEINDLFEFLASKDRQHDEEVQRLHGEKVAAQTQYEQVQIQYEQAQTYITHLADERMPEVDENDFEMFLKHLHTLTPKEREIFNLYLAGKKAKEITEIAKINPNTLKYHNKNIYSKLGVTSRKQLLEYAALLKYGKDGYDL